MPEDQARDWRRGGWDHEELTALLADLARIVPQHGRGLVGGPPGSQVLASANVEVMDLVREVMRLCGGEEPAELPAGADDASREEPPDSTRIDRRDGRGTADVARAEPSATAQPPAPADTPASAEGIDVEGDFWSHATFDDPLSLISPASGEGLSSDLGAASGPGAGSIPAVPSKLATTSQTPSEAGGPGIAAIRHESHAPAAHAEALPAHDDAASAPAPIELRAVDAAIAGGVDELLGGSFESVADVLSGVFEEHAAVVQDVERVLAEVPAEPSAGLPPRAAARESAEFASAAAAAEGGREPADAALLPARNPRHDREPAHVASQPPAPPQTTQPTAKVEPRESDSADEERAGAGRIEVARLNALRRLGPALVAPLVLLSLPLRFVPPAVRPFVDWVALSLLLWVPIVWVAALFL